MFDSLHTTKHQSTMLHSPSQGPRWAVQGGTQTQRTQRESCSVSCFQGRHSTSGSRHRQWQHRCTALLHPRLQPRGVTCLHAHKHTRSRRRGSVQYLLWASRLHSFMKVSEHAYTVQYSVLLDIAYVHLTYTVTARLYWSSCVKHNTYLINVLLNTHITLLYVCMT